MSKAKNKILSLALAIIMVALMLSMVNMTAFAAVGDTFRIKVDLRNTPLDASDDIDMTFKMLTEHDGDGNGGTVQVSSGEQFKAAIENTTAGKIAIPSTVTNSGSTYNVTSIGDYAFNGCTDLTNITLPYGIISIEDYAFTNCSTLATVYFDGNYPITGNTGISSIRDEATTYYNSDATGWFQSANVIPVTVTLDGELVYNGIEQTQGVTTVSVGSDAIASAGYTISDNAATDVGDYTLTVAITHDGYPFTITKAFSILQSATNFEGGIKTYKSNEATITTTFIYGDTITVKVTPKATGTKARLVAPTQNQMALFIGNTQITAPQNVTNGQELTFTIDTADKTIPSTIFTGTEQELSAKYMGSDNMANHAETVSITLSKLPLTWSVGSVNEKVYDGTTDATVLTQSELNGVLVGDDVTAVDGSVEFASKNANDISPVEASDYGITGTHVQYYVAPKNQPNFSSGKIAKREISATILEVANKVYDGTETVDITNIGFDGLQNGESFTRNTDYTATAVFDSKNADSSASVTATIVLKNTPKSYNYILTNGVNYSVDTGEITAKPLADSMLGDITSQTYTGSEIKPTLSVVDGAPSIITSSDYTVKYSNNINAGTATVTITATQDGNYTGGITKNFTITKAAPTLVVKDFSRIYDGVAVVNPNASEMTIIGANYADITFAYFTDDSGTKGAQLATAPTNAGIFWVVASVVESGNYNAAESVAKQFTISQANQTGTPQELLVKTEYQNDYEFDLRKLLPRLSEGQDFGNVSYSVGSVTNNAGVLTDAPATDDIIGGKLTLYVANVATTGAAVTVEINITTENYNFSNPVTLTVKTVDKYHLEITATMISRGYNGTALAYAGTPIFVNIATNDAVTGVEFTTEYEGRDGTTYNKTTTAPIDAGKYNLILTVSDGSANIYAGSTTIGFEISKVDATVTAQDESAFIGELEPDYTFTPSGFVNGESISDVRYTDNSANMDTAGEYAITPSGGTVSGGGARNYNITYVEGKLNVTVDTTSLQTAIASAKTAKNGITINDSTPSSVASGTKFVATAVMTTFNDAITVAENVVNTATTNVEVTNAITALEVAKTIFTDAIRTGTYVVPSSGNSSGGSSSSTPSNEIDSGKEVSVSKIGDILEDGEDLVIDGDDGIEAVFDTDAIEAILEAAGTDADDIEIIIEEAASSMLNDRQKATVGDRPVLNLQVLVDGKVVANFGSGEVSITFPYELKEGETAENLVIYYLDEDGNIVEKIDVVYDEDREEVTFKLNYFSIYMLAYEEPTTESSNPFADVAEKDWFYDDVMYVYGNGIMTGVSESAFAPQDTATRAMIWTVFARMNGIDTAGGDMWYSKALDWSIAEGVSDGTEPNGNITREQLVTMLYRFENPAAVTMQTILSQFTDSDMISEYAVPAMEWAVAKGIMNGSDGMLNPQGNATRTEIAVIMHRFMEME